MTDSSTRGRHDLAGFRAALAEASLQVAGPLAADGLVQVITYDRGQFDLRLRGPGAPDFVQRLSPDELVALLASLRAELEHPPAGLDAAALQAFVDVLYQVAHRAGR